MAPAPPVNPHPGTRTHAGAAPQRPRHELRGTRSSTDQQDIPDSNTHVKTIGYTELDILCGLDLRVGGMWLGLNKTMGAYPLRTSISSTK